MRNLRLAVAATASFALACCGGPSPSPSAPSPSGRTTSAVGQPASPASDLPCSPIGFEDAGSNGAAFSAYTRCGLTLAATTPNWSVSTTYGRPAPFILFSSPAGATTIGEILVTAAGAKFKFQSVDLYSSTTKIPYVITGAANGATVFTIQNTQGNTFGNFATVVNPNATTLIDALTIRLSNPSAPCCPNPMGLDNIVIAY